MSMSDNDPSFAEKEKTTKTNTAAPGEAPPEVFDSSTYDSMTDLNASATMNESEVSKVLSDTENKEPVEPEAVPIEATTTTTPPPPPNANIPPPPPINTTVTPTLEGLASALKKSKEKENKSISKQLDKQTTQINKKITQIVQPLQKHVKSVDRQSKLIKQLQSQLKQLQRQVSQVQRGINIGKKKQK